MNKLGVHALVWEAGWSEDECARAIAKTAEVGFDFIEAPALDPSLIDPVYTRRQLEAAGIGINFSLGLGFDSDISSGDADKRRRGRQKLEDAVAVCRDCGGEFIGGILYSAFGKYDRPPTADGIAQSAETLNAVAEIAAQSGITLVLEVVNRYETNICNTAAQGVEMVRRVGAPNVKVHLDVYHMNIEESDISAALTDTGEYLGYFHTGDSHRGYLGSGTIDLAHVFRALVRMKYRGPITFESFSSRVVGQPLEGILGIWRNLWNDSDHLAAHANRFIRDHLAAVSTIELH